MKKYDPKNFLTRLRILIEQLHQIDFGYSLGENIAHSPLAGSDLLTSQLEFNRSIQPLVPLYEACDGFSLPDVRNGLFTSKLSVVIADDNHPNKIIGHVKSSILVFGSTGGGDLLAIDQESGNVLLLGPGLIQERNYISDSSNVVHVAEDCEKFMQRVLKDVESFINNDSSHPYIA